MGKEIIGAFTALIIGFILALAAAFFLLGCKTSIKSDDFKGRETAFDYLVCVEYAGEKSDKTICSGFSTVHEKAMLEKSYAKRVEFCKEFNIYGFDTKKECLFFLNQK